MDWNAVCWRSREWNPGPFACDFFLLSFGKKKRRPDAAKRTLYQLSHTPVEVFILDLDGVVVR